MIKYVIVGAVAFLVGRWSASNSIELTEQSEARITQLRADAKEKVLDGLEESPIRIKERR